MGLISRVSSRTYSFFSETNMNRFLICSRRALNKTTCQITSINPDTTEQQIMTHPYFENSTKVTFENSETGKSKSALVEFKTAADKSAVFYKLYRHNKAHSIQYHGYAPSQAIGMNGWAMTLSNVYPHRKNEILEVSGIPEGVTDAELLEKLKPANEVVRHFFVSGVRAYFDNENDMRLAFANVNIEGEMKAEFAVLKKDKKKTDKKSFKPRETQEESVKRENVYGL